MSKETSVQVHEAPPLKARQYIAYGMGDFGNNFSWTYISTFLMFFYTDVFGISATSVATLVLVARIWDAVNDPVIGALADKTKSRWGRYRPWELFSSPFCAIMVIFTYWARPTWGDSSKIIYMYVTYFLLVLAYTMVNLPYGTLASVMTQNMHERAKITTVRFFFAQIAMQLINATTHPLVSKLGGGDNQKGFLYVSCIYACIFVVCHVICFSQTREVVPIPPQQKKLPFSLQFKVASQNLPFILVSVGQLFLGFNVYGRSSVFMYYFKYVENNVALFSVMSLVIVGPKVLGTLVFPSLFKKIGNKGRVCVLASFCAAASLMVLHFCRASVSPIIFFGVVAVLEFFQGIFSPAIFSAVADTAEYGQWKTGIRNDGFLYAFSSLGMKIGMAIGSAGVVAVMGHFGYVANQAQNPQVISAISHFFTTMPAIVWVMTGILMLFYNINQESFAKMVKEIKEREANTQE